MSTETREQRYQRYADSHIDTKGPGDARPTALDVVKDEGMLGKLAGKVILITGASSGIGIETARALHATDATLYLPVRHLEKGEAVTKDILATSKGKGDITVLELDLEDLDSVRKCAQEFLKQSKQLNILVNNAGIMAVPTRELTKQGYESQFACCHLAHFLLFQLLKDTLLSSSTPDFPSRVVNVSSVGHRYGPGVQFDNLDFDKDYSGWAAYSQAKTANIYMANYIERVYGPRGIHANSLMPGGIATGLQKHVPEMASMMEQPAVAAFMKSTSQGAATTVWAAISDDFKNRGGLYLEDVAVAGPYDTDKDNQLAPGYGAHAFDKEKEDRLWKMSNELVGFKET